MPGMAWMPGRIWPFWGRGLGAMGRGLGGAVGVGGWGRSKTISLSGTVSLIRYQADIL